MIMNRTTWLVVALALVGCSEVGKPEPTKPEPVPAAATDVAIELSGVTLGDDCGAAAPPPAQPGRLASADSLHAPSAGGRAPSADSARAPAATSAGACADPRNCHGPALADQACEQTSMQLSLRATRGPGPTTIRVKQVELLDASGKVVGVLTASKPSQWDAKGNYVTWNESVAPSQVLATSYTLSAPDWTAISNGRWNAHAMAFKLRVTVVVGTSERTSERMVEKQSISPAMLPAAVST